LSSYLIKNIAKSYLTNGLTILIVNLILKNRRVGTALSLRVLKSYYSFCRKYGIYDKITENKTKNET